jgi:hypothetical protein
MITKIIEATNGPNNWGKFLIGRMDAEWSRRSAVSGLPLLREIGWGLEHVWVLDLQTGEGACFMPRGLASFDLNEHRVWVCPLFEPFLTWLYRQDLSDLALLPDSIDLPDAPFAFRGYRRLGPEQGGSESEGDSKRREVG